MGRHPKGECNPPKGCFDCAYPECVNLGRPSSEKTGCDKVTEKELGQVYYLRKEIKMWEEELRRLGVYRSPAFDGVGSSAVPNPTVAYVERREKLLAIIEGKKAEAELQERNITEYITGVADSRVRQILYLRHIKLMSWRAIAFRIGGGSTEESVRKTHSRFIERTKKPG